MTSGDADFLDEEFPLGDGTAETGAMVVCPYCGEAVEIALDPGGGAAQKYVEDCEVCCRPWRVIVRYAADGSAEVLVDSAE
ncbi:MAG: CPXCG motif-containing cysteine-rich protein [Gemmatimonadales bacterium]